MKVICDWDYPNPGKKATLKRGFKLFVYFLSQYFHFLRKYCKEIYLEHMIWIQIYNEIEKLTGNKMIYGIRPDVKRKFNTFIKELEKRYDVRLHLHMWFEEDRKIFKEKFGYKPNSHVVSWLPKIKNNKLLINPKNIFLDFKSCEKNIKKLKKDDIAVFHPDHKERSLLLYLKLLNYKKGKKHGK